MGGDSRREWFGWFWTATVELLAIHEKAYLDHFRRYALSDRAA